MSFPFLSLGSLPRRQTWCNRIFTPRQNQRWMDYALSKSFHFWKVMSYSTFPMTFPISACLGLAFVSRILSLWVLSEKGLHLTVSGILHLFFSPGHLQAPSFCLRWAHPNPVACIWRLSEPLNIWRSLEVTVAENSAAAAGAKQRKTRANRFLRRRADGFSN